MRPLIVNAHGAPCCAGVCSATTAKTWWYRNLVLDGVQWVCDMCWTSRITLLHKVKGWKKWDGLPLYAPGRVLSARKRSRAAVPKLMLQQYTSNAFVVDNALTEEMVHRLGLQAKQQEWSPAVVNGKARWYRRSDVATLSSPQLAAALWDRLKSLSDWAVLPEARDIDIDVNSRWRAIGIHSDFSFLRYQHRGERFLKHQDGTKVANNSRSFMTLLIYLEAPDAGGETLLFADDEATACVRPVIGRCLIFRHSMWHSGEAVVTGTKIVLRGDVMFEEVAQS